MKKIFILFTLLCLLLTGCFSRGVDISADARHFGMNVLSAVDDYLSGERDASLTASFVQEQCYQLSSVYVPEINKDSTLKSVCEAVNYTMQQISEGENHDINYLISIRNQLADLMGEKRWK